MVDRLDVVAVRIADEGDVNLAVMPTWSITETSWHEEPQGRRLTR